MKQDVAAPPSRVALQGPLLVRPASDTPLAGLAGSGLSRRFRHWRGASGRRYLFSIYPLCRPDAIDDAPRFDDAVIMAVSRDEAGDRSILAAEETGTLPDLFYAGAGFRDAVLAGANEIHVHLLTDTAEGRATLLHDLLPAQAL